MYTIVNDCVSSSLYSTVIVTVLGIDMPLQLAYIVHSVCAVNSLQLAPGEEHTYR